MERLSLVSAFVGLCLATVLSGFAEPVLAGPLLLAPVGPPIPGNGPVGLAIAETRGGTNVFVAENLGNQVRSHRIDRQSGTLSPVGSVPLPNGPSALAVTPGGQYLLATTLQGNDVTPYAIDPNSGTLSPVGAVPVPTGGTGPVNLDISKGGFVVIANKDSDNLGVVQIDPRTGTLSPVGAVPVGDGPNDVKVTGRYVVVGHRNSNDVHLYQLNDDGSLFPLDVKSVGTSGVTGVAVRGADVAVGTFAGKVHGFRIVKGKLVPCGVSDTGGDLTDIVFDKKGNPFVAGGIPGRLSVFGFKRYGLQEVGTFAFPPGMAPTSRTLATVRGGTTYVVVNEFQGNQTWVIKAQAE
jgi:DNA-binding beta-propeller fold protein YncE